MRDDSRKNSDGVTWVGATKWKYYLIEKKNILLLAYVTTNFLISVLMVRRYIFLFLSHKKLSWWRLQQQFTFCLSCHLVLYQFDRGVNIRNILLKSFSLILSTTFIFLVFRLFSKYFVYFSFSSQYQLLDLHYMTS
jgi:hypothetical protein